MEFKQQFITNKYNRPGIAMTPTTLTVHSTGNPPSTAQNERDNINRADNHKKVSFHYVVDDKDCIACIPPNEVAWHASTESGNKTSLALEICESGDRTKTLHNAIIATASILKQYGWGVDKLRRHYDWSGKDCPRILIDEVYRKDAYQTWEWFKKEVERAMTGKELESVNDIVWELSNRGIITNKELWLKKLAEDNDTYWLARKCANALRG